MHYSLTKVKYKPPGYLRVQPSVKANFGTVFIPRQMPSYVDMMQKA